MNGGHHVSSNVFVTAEMNSRLDQERRSVLQEMSVEREHHQRLVKEHGRLQQRMENLLEERNSKGQGHTRHSSDVSSISLDSSVPDSGINIEEQRANQVACLLPLEFISLQNFWQGEH